jgi:hypothetical protein
MKIRQLLAGLILMAVALSAAALERQFPANAKRGVASFAYYPKIIIDNQEYRGGPGLRIWNTSNVIPFQTSLKDENVVINYTVDSYNLINRIWILTPEEAARPLAGQPLQAPPTTITITRPVKNTTATTTIQMP